MSGNLDSLTAELERATEGSEELDVAICKALCNYGPDDPLWHVMHYSRSLDAALTLVPEGWVWHVQIDYELPGRASLYNAVLDGKDDPPVHVQADGATPVLALCIAALRAR